MFWRKEELHVLTCLMRMSVLNSSVAEAERLVMKLSHSVNKGG